MITVAPEVDGGDQSYGLELSRRGWIVSITLLRKLM